MLSLAFTPRRLRTRLKFTREGRYFVAITLGVGFAAVNTGNNLLYLLLGMLLSMIVVSGILSEQTLRGLTAERDLPREVYAGQPFLTGITVLNRKRRLPSFSVQVEDVLDGPPSAKKCYFLKIPPGAQQQTSYRTELPRRGPWRFEGFRLRTRYPFGFFLKSRLVDGPAELLVYPRMVPVGELPDSARAMLGPLPSPRRGRGREFHGLRGWREGDDARDVHWKRSAREGRLVLREYESETSRRVVVLLNARAPAELSDEVLDPAVDLAASLVAHFARRGFEVELRLDRQRVVVGAEARGLSSAMRALALATFDRDEASARPALLPGTGPVFAVTHPRARGLLPRLPAHAVVLEAG